MLQLIPPLAPPGRLPRPPPRCSAGVTQVTPPPTGKHLDPLVVALCCCGPSCAHSCRRRVWGRPPPSSATSSAAAGNSSPSVRNPIPRAAHLNRLGVLGPSIMISSSLCTQGLGNTLVASVRRACPPPVVLHFVLTASSTSAPLQPRCELLPSFSSFMLVLASSLCRTLELAA